MLVDNVKTSRFSWSDLEALITCDYISGRKMYVGDGRRPNTLVVAITMNGACVSKDIAQRSVIIRLKRPTYSGNWESDTADYIDKHRIEPSGRSGRDAQAAARSGAPGRSPGGGPGSATFWGGCNRPRRCKT